MKTILIDNDKFVESLKNEINKIYDENVNDYIYLFDNDSMQVQCSPKKYNSKQIETKNKINFLMGTRVFAKSGTIPKNIKFKTEILN